MRCRFLTFLATSVALEGFYARVPVQVSRHPLREKEPPSESLLQRNRRGGDRRKELEQIQKPVASINTKLFAQRQRNPLLAEQRHESRSNCFPEGALNKSLQPPLSPALQGSPVDPQLLARDAHA